MNQRGHPNYSTPVLRKQLQHRSLEESARLLASCCHKGQKEGTSHRLFSSSTTTPHYALPPLHCFDKQQPKERKEKGSNPGEIRTRRLHNTKWCYIDGSALDHHPLDVLVERRRRKFVTFLLF